MSFTVLGGSSKNGFWPRLIISAQGKAEYARYLKCSWHKPTKAFEVDFTRVEVDRHEARLEAGELHFMSSTNTVRPKAGSHPHMAFDYFITCFLADVLSVETLMTSQS